MSTFWVTGKDASPAVLPNPRPVPDLPIPHVSAPADRFFSPPPPSLQEGRLSLPPTSSFRPTSPKPDEWPQAQQQLERFSPEVFDQSVPLGCVARARRNTAPSPSYVSPAVLDIGKAPRRLHDVNRTPLPLSEVSATLQKQGQLLRRQTSQNMDLQRPANPPELRACPHFGEQDTLGSEPNLMTLRGSISIPPLSIPPLFGSGDPVHEMEAYALQVEENAKQARQLADWASSIVQRLKSRGITGNGGVVTGNGGVVTGNEVEGEEVGIEVTIKTVADGGKVPGSAAR